MSLSSKEVIKYFQNIVNELNNYYLSLGVFVDNAKRTVNVGITNAQLLFIHENGSPLQNIPARPVLQIAIDYASKYLLPIAIRNCLQNAIYNTGITIEDELKALAMQIENYAKKIIYDNDGRLAPNALSVQRAKGKKVDKSGQTLINHPLFDTGELARSITCIVVKR